MNERVRLLNKDLYYYYIFLLTGIIYIYSTSKIESFLLINRNHNEFLDTVMPCITFLGDGKFAAIVSVLFFIFRPRYGIYLAIAFIVSGIFIQLLKHIVFPDQLRPVAYFGEIGVEIYKISGYNTALKFSFPSGHATTAFACFIGISFLTERWFLKVLLLFLAILAGFSRVYLAVHFPVDVIGGSLLGVLSAYLTYIWISSWKKPWLDVSLTARLQKAIKNED